MGLQTALYTAKSGLHTTAAQTATVSRNITSANQAGYANRVTLLETYYDGVGVAAVQRATANALQTASLSAISEQGASQARQAGLDLLHASIGDPEDARSPAALAGALKSALVGAASSPQDSNAAQTAIGAAKNLANALNKASQATQDLRNQADAQMSDGVNKLNALLGQFDALNQSIVRGTKSGIDVNDALDQRDAILQQMSQYVGISTTQSANGGMAIYADGGATLYQDGPRAVSMSKANGLAPGQTGGAVYIDGMAVTGPNAAMAIHSGALAGYAQTRDVDAPTYQTQLDAIAGGLINAFSETDQSGGTQPQRAGLITWSGGPATPNAAATPGLAGLISINPAGDPAQGGDWAKLRDGGLNGAAYVYNKTGASGYSDRLSALGAAMSQSQAIDPALGFGATASLLDLATKSAANLETTRQAATTAATSSSARAQYAAAALSNATGVNIDDQMTLMLELERTYQASAKMISTVNQMYQAFLDGVR